MRTARNGTMKIRYFSRREIMQKPALAQHCFAGEDLNWAIAAAFDELEFFARAVVADEGREQVFVHPGNNFIILHVLRKPEPPRMLASFATIDDESASELETKGDFVEVDDSTMVSLITRPFAA